jgi:hypothetical protein
METENAVKVKGFFHLQIQNPDGEIVGDSGVCENTVTNDGKRYYLAALLGNYAGSSQIGYAALGTAGAPAAADTTLPSELAEGVRDAVAAASGGSTSVVFTGTFASGDAFVTATRALSNIGLFAGAAAGSIFAGAAYTSSSCGTNQNVNYTYTITFT